MRGGKQRARLPNVGLVVARHALAVLKPVRF
jgi:hypothetical protein